MSPCLMLLIAEASSRLLLTHSVIHDCIYFGAGLDWRASAPRSSFSGERSRNVSKFWPRRLQCAALPDHSLFS